MKKRRLQRRSKRLLAALLLIFLVFVGGTYAYISLRGELLLRDFKVLVEKTLSQNFKARVSIGDVKGGIFYPITFSDIIVYTSLEGEEKLLEISGLSLNYRLWDIIFNLDKRVCNINLVSPTFFVNTERDYEDKFKREKSSFFAPRVQIDMKNGAIISNGKSAALINEASGRIFFSEDSADLKDMCLKFRSLPITVNGKINNIYSESPHFDIALSSQDNYGNVSIYAKGPLRNLTLEGKMEMTSGDKLNFSTLCDFHEGNLHLKDISFADTLKIKEGNINLNEKKFDFTLLSQDKDDAEIILGGTFAIPNISLYGNIKHWSVRRFDLITNIKVEAQFKQGVKTPLITGVLDTENTIINYKPCEELSLQFSLKRNAIEILGLKWGKSFRMVGKIELEPPYNIELIALLDGTKLEELVSFGGEELRNVVAGTVKGRLEVDGPLADCTSRGHITSRNGYIGNVYYENGVIHLAGKGPLITVGDSRIYKEKGYLIVDGEIDLRKLGKRNIFEDVKVKTDDETIVWDGWDISKEATADEVSLKKRINEELEVGFKTPIDNGYKMGPEDRKGEEIELKYKIRDSESLKMKIKNEEEFVGVEHKVKF